MLTITHGKKERERTTSFPGNANRMVNANSAISASDGRTLAHAVANCLHLNWVILYQCNVMCVRTKNTIIYNRRLGRGG